MNKALDAMMADPAIIAALEYSSDNCTPDSKPVRRKQLGVVPAFNKTPHGNSRGADGTTAHGRGGWRPSVATCQRIANETDNGTALWKSGAAARRAGAGSLGMRPPKNPKPQPSSNRGLVPRPTSKIGKRRRKRRAASRPPKSPPALAATVADPPAATGAPPRGGATIPLRPWWNPPGMMLAVFGVPSPPVPAHHVAETPAAPEPRVIPAVATTSPTPEQPASASALAGVPSLVIHPPAAASPSAAAASPTDAASPLAPRQLAADVVGTCPTTTDADAAIPATSPAADTGPSREQSSYPAVQPATRLLLTMAAPVPKTATLPSVPVQAPATHSALPVLRILPHGSCDVPHARPAVAAAGARTRGAPVITSPHVAHAFRGKGSKHANRVAGPYACALAHMPPLEPTGAKRARLGLADVPLLPGSAREAKAERAARSLTALLPAGAAAVILHDDQDELAARPVEDVAEDIVAALSAYGYTAVEAAASALGRLLTWVADNKPPGTRIGGSVVAEYVSAVRPSGAFRGHLRFLLDHCGVDLPARAPVSRGFRKSAGGRAHENDKESFGLFIVLALERTAHEHPSTFVRGQAAAWLFLALHALRVEQSRGLAISAWVQHGGATITCAAVLRDKHPDASKQRPRPVWGCFDGILIPGAARAALIEALTGAETVRCVLRDTDSPNGDPTRATRWIAAGVESTGRVDASLHALLAIAGLPPAVAKRYHGHSPKRFLLNVIEASSSLDAASDGLESGRFAQSTAQAPDLEPVEAMLHEHRLRSATLPDIYAGKAKVEKVFDRAAAVHSVLCAAAAASSGSPDPMPQEHGFAQLFGGL